MTLVATAAVRNSVCMTIAPFVKLSPCATISCPATTCSRATSGGRKVVAPALEKQIEDCLRSSLGYEVATFVRTTSEVRAARFGRNA